MQDDAADQLDVKRSQAERPPRAFAGNGKSRDQQVVQRLAISQLLAELNGLGSQGLIGKRFGFSFQGVDGIDLGFVAPHTAVIR